MRSGFPELHHYLEKTLVNPTSNILWNLNLFEHNGLNRYIISIDHDLPIHSRRLLNDVATYATSFIPPSQTRILLKSPYGSPSRSQSQASVNS